MIIWMKLFKRKNKKIIIVFPVFLAICVLTAYITYNRGNTSDVNREIGSSKTYSEKQINKAFDTIERTFALTFRGCTLIELRFEEERMAKEVEEYKTNYNREVIVIYSSFATDDQAYRFNLVPNFIYRNWSWTLEKTKFGWKIINYGCA